MNRKLGTALNMIFNNHFSPDEPGIFEPIRDMLLTSGDYYMHLADLTAYVETQGELHSCTRISERGPKERSTMWLVPGSSPVIGRSRSMHGKSGT